MLVRLIPYSLRQSPVDLSIFMRAKVGINFHFLSVPPKPTPNYPIYVQGHTVLQTLYRRWPFDLTAFLKNKVLMRLIPYILRQIPLIFLYF